MSCLHGIKTCNRLGQSVLHSQVDLQRKLLVASFTQKTAVIRVFYNLKFTISSILRPGCSSFQMHEVFPISP